jgi:hypothetical protein
VSALPPVALLEPILEVRVDVVLVPRVDDLLSAVPAW